MTHDTHHHPTETGHSHDDGHAPQPGASSAVISHPGGHATGHPTGHEGHDGHGGGHDGHGGGHGDHVGQFRRLFFSSLVLAAPVVAFSPMFAMLLGYQLPSAAWVDWVSPLLGTVLFGWGGRPFLTGAVSEVRSRRPGMMLLIALAITVAFVGSWGASLGVLDHQLDFWWELALLVVIMLLGHWIEMRSLARTTSALDSLAELLPDLAERVHGDQVEQVPPDQLQVGDRVIVRPGGRVPADGQITQGSASMDESMITGESVPVRRDIGDQVVAGTVATDSGIRVQVTAIGEDTALAGIRRLVTDAQNSSSRAQRLADTAAGWLFWFALGAAAITAVVWTAFGLPDDAVVRTITVLVIACPHALGLAIPLVVSIATERAARAGVLVKDRLALEQMRTVDAVLFDKTGTLTKGAPAVLDIATVDVVTTDQLLTWAAAAEADSEHPLARAIVTAAAHRDLTIPAATDFTSAPAIGVTATVENRRIAVGGPNLLTHHQLTALPATSTWHDHGSTVLHVLADNQIIGAIELADEIRPESRQAVQALQHRGVQVVMITGDAEPVAAAVARQLGIDRYFAGVRPEDKAATVQSLQNEGRSVAMVGDGVNDAPALAQADVGIAIGAGTDVAIGSAGVILAGDDPRAVLSIITLSHAAYRKMAQNLWWAAGYNLLSVPLAAGILAPIGFVLPMSVGAILMSASTVVVALNAQLLRRIDLRPDRLTNHTH